MNLAKILQSEGKFSEAIGHYRKIISANPDDITAHNRLGMALLETNQIDEAYKHFSIVLKEKPDSFGTLNNLAWCLAVDEGTKVYSPNTAIKYAEEACRLTNYQNYSLLDTLAVSYAAAGRFDDAIESTEKAIVLAKKDKKLGVTEELRNRVKLYLARKPFHIK